MGTNRKEYTAESVERALDLHVQGKWRWLDHQTRKGPWANGGFLVDTGVGTVEFTLAQAYAYVVGFADCDRQWRNRDFPKPKGVTA